MLNTICGLLDPGVPPTFSVDYLVIAGGGGGASAGGGGGAGGYLTSTLTGLAPATNYTVTIGAGGTGTGGSGGANSTNGSNSIFSSITIVKDSYK